MGFFDRFLKKEKRELDYINPNSYGIGLPNTLFNTNRRTVTYSSVFAAVELISNSIAQLPIYIKSRNEFDSDIIFDHNLNKLFSRMIMSKFILIKKLIEDMLLHGNGFAYIKRDMSGKPINLIYCEPGSVTINYNSNSGVLYYIIPKVKKGKIEPIDVIHLYKNTNDGINGISIDVYANKSIKLLDYTEKAAENYFGSGCNLSGILSTDQPKLNEKTRQDIKDSWTKTYGGNNTGGVAVLECGMKYQSISSNSKDSQMLESREYNVVEIARYFNISPVLLGDLSKSSYGTLEAANLEFVSHTLMPYITLIQEEFNRKLLLPSEYNLYIDLDEGYLIKANKVDTANYLSTLTSSGIISINEARRSLGYNSIEGGDKHIIPYTDLNKNTVENNNEQGDSQHNN